MTDSTVAIDEPAAIDKRMDTEQLTVATVVVQRERVQVAGTTDTAIAAVLDADPAGTNFGLVVRPIVETAAGAIFAKLTDGTDTALVTAAGELNIIAATTTNAGATAKTSDYDTGAGTDTVTMFGVALPGAGGAVAGGTSTNPIRVDPTGTTTQPVSGTVTANAGTNLNTSALALEAGGNLASILTSAQLIDDIVHSGDAVLSKYAVIGGVLDDTAPVAVTENQAQSVRITPQRGLHVQLRSGTAEVGTSGAPLRVDPTGTTAQPVTDNAGTLTVDAPVGTPVAVRVSDGAAFVDVRAGDVAHDGVDSGNPVKVGLKAIAHGTNPTAVAAADRTDWYANRAGVPFIIGGHPNIVTVEAAYTTAQTDAAIVTVAAGLKIVVTAITMTADNANTVDVGFRVGFGAVTTPTTTGVVLTHPGVAAGSGMVRGDGSGILGIGADGEDLRITSEVPTTGSIRINVTYYTIES